MQDNKWHESCIEGAAVVVRLGLLFYSLIGPVISVGLEMIFKKMTPDDAT